MIEINREKVIRGLEISIISDTDAGFSTIEIPVQQAENILALLKEQEPQRIVKKWHNNPLGDYSRLHCPKCDNEIERPRFIKLHDVSYCPYCGQAVKWE